MNGTGTRKSQRKPNGSPGVAENEETDGADPGHAKLMLEGLPKLSKEIQGLRTMMRSDLTSFKVEHNKT